MKKAFTLIELLVVIVVLPSVMVVISGIFRTFFRDIPRDTRLLQENTTLFDMLQCIRADMDQANSLPESTGGTRSGASSLLIELPEHVVCYQLQDGAVTRTTLQQNAQAQPEAERTWRLPDAMIAWQRWKRGGDAYAVEVRTHLQQRVDGRLFERLKNSHVYFVNELGKVGTVE
jgi:prepilin-type N-terminal cleavage/methylation domain-containing protein